VAVYVWVVTFGTAMRGLGSPPRSLLAVPNVTAHPSTASVSITVLLYFGPLLCGFSVAIKASNHAENSQNLLISWTHAVIL